MDDLFEWDPAKASSNLEMHGVSFEEAQSVFLDTTSLTIPDPLPLKWRTEIHYYWYFRDGYNIGCRSYRS